MARVKDITGGKGVKVVYDSVGKDTWDKSLDCLQPFGLMASFGNASGPVPPFAPGVLGAKGSLYVTRPTLANYISREELDWRSKDLFNWIASGKLKVRIDKVYSLAEAAQVSPKHLCRLFMRELHSSPMRTQRLLQCQLSICQTLFRQLQCIIGILQLTTSLILLAICRLIRHLCRQ